MIKPAPLWPSNITVPSRVKDVVLKMCDKYGLTPSDIFGPSRKKPIPTARGETYYRLYEIGFTLTQMGYYFGRDHTTVVYSMAKWQNANGMPKLTNYTTRDMRKKVA